MKAPLYIALAHKLWEARDALSLWGVFVGFGMVSLVPDDFIPWVHIPYSKAAMAGMILYAMRKAKKGWDTVKPYLVLYGQLMSEHNILWQDKSSEMGWDYRIPDGTVIQPRGVTFKQGRHL